MWVVGPPTACDPKSLGNSSAAAATLSPSEGKEAEGDPGTEAPVSLFWFSKVEQCTGMWTC